MNEHLDQRENIQEMSDEELVAVVGGYSPGDRVVYKEYTKCPLCLGSIPSATLQFYRGLDPNSERAWIVRTDCCGTIATCVESGVRPL